MCERLFVINHFDNSRLWILAIVRVMIDNLTLQLCTGYDRQYERRTDKDC